MERGRSRPARHRPQSERHRHRRRWPRRRPRDHPQDDQSTQTFDSTVGKAGQIEYLQLAVTVHTLPNRADTDGDGLNDSEEMNFGFDGFRTNAWKGDTDSDGVPDNFETGGWTWSGSTIVVSP